MSTLKKLSMRREGLFFIVIWSMILFLLTDIILSFPTVSNLLYGSSTGLLLATIIDILLYTIVGYIAAWFLNLKSMFSSGIYLIIIVPITWVLFALSQQTTGDIWVFITLLVLSMILAFIFGSMGGLLYRIKHYNKKHEKHGNHTIKGRKKNVRKKRRTKKS